jgi:adenylate cyclase
VATEKVKRKLTAILSADVKGYSRLMGEDEEWTLRTLNTYKEVMGSFIQQYRGRIVGTAGDSVLAEFASVVDAVQCAVEIQQVLRAKNALLPETRRMEFRIGINLGDVIDEGDTIYGDGVNIAARLEGLAEAGGICISESAYQQIENKLPLRYDYLGEHEVKNIAKPVRVYRARIEPEAAPSKLAVEKRPVGKGLSKAAIGIIAVIVIAVGAILYQFVFRPSSKTEVASKEKMALPLPDKPSIVVLPFVNMSEDPKQDFFVDGLTEEIINALSRLPQIFVIARNSSFAYKGKTVDVKQVGRELGVQYILEGSVRREGNRIRITAQLIDSSTGRHVFSERYDRELKDIFATQDDIAIKILTALRIALKDGEWALLQAKGVSNVEAYFKLLEVRKLREKVNKESNNRARLLVEEALLLDPNSSAAYAALAAVHFWDYWLGPPKSPEDSIQQGIAMARKAITLDNNPGAHGTLAMLYVNKGDYDKAIEEGELAASMDPGFLTAWGSTLMHACRPSEAITVLQKVLRLNPVEPPSMSLANLARSYQMLGKYEESIQIYKRLLKDQPNHLLGNIGLTATYSMMGRVEEARAQAEEVLRINPKFSLEGWAKTLRLKNPDYTAAVLDALGKAGLK